MRSYRRSRIVRLVVVGMVLWQWSCAGTRPIAAATPPSPEVRTQLGVVSVVSARANGSSIHECVATSTSLSGSAAEWTADDDSQFKATLAVTADSLARRQIVEALPVRGASEAPAQRESSDVTGGQP